MGRRMTALLLVLLQVVFLSGCWDKVEIDDRNYVITMGIDKYSGADETRSMNEGEGDRITLSLGNAVLKKEGEGGKQEEKKDEKKAELLSGETLSGAMKLSDSSGSRRVYFGHTKAVVLGRELLSDRALLMEVLDGLERNTEISAKMVVLAADGKAADAVEAIAASGEDTGLFLWDFYKNNAKNTSSTMKMDFENLVLQVRNTKDALIPLIKASDGAFTLSGAALLRDGAFCGYLDEKQMEGALFLLSDAGGAVLEAEYKEARLPLRVIRNRTAFSFSEQDGRILCRTDIKVSGSLEGYELEGERLFDPAVIRRLEGLFSEAVKQETENTLRALQETYQTDCLMFAERLRKWNAPLYQKFIAEEEIPSQNMERKDRLFLDMDFEIVVETDISGIGVTM